VDANAANLPLRMDRDFSQPRRPDLLDAEPAAPASSLPSVEMPQRRARRISWNWISFLLMVALPTILAAVYLYGFAADQYVSEFRFRLHHAQPSRMESTSALAGLTGAGAALETMTDSEIVVQYLQSQQILADIQPAIDLEQIYSRSSADWHARLDKGEPVELKLKYWRRMVDPFFDNATSIVTVKVRAFDAADAQRVSRAALAAAEKLVNTLSERANADRLRYAQQTIEKASAAWKQAELELRSFRNANDVLFPTMQATESTGLDSNLRVAESKARAALEALHLQGVPDSSPQARTLLSQIGSLQAEIKRTQTRVTNADAGGATGRARPLASVVSDYDALDVNVKIASEAYKMAVMAEQRARDEANQQHIYLDPFVPPGLAEKSMYPVRWRDLLEVGFLSFAIWCLSLLLWRGVMDHID
jgi:capsular polysaccharide transport system permease protein